MSAVDEYRKKERHVYDDFIWELADAAIEELEAELAALKERYCDECERESQCSVLAAAYEDFNDLGEGGPDFACNRWEARP